MLEGTEGATAIMDNMIIAGKTVEDHNKVLKQVLLRSTAWTLKLNLEKYK